MNAYQRGEIAWSLHGDVVCWTCTYAILAQSYFVWVLRWSVTESRFVWYDAAAHLIGDCLWRFCWTDCIFGSFLECWYWSGVPILFFYWLIFLWVDFVTFLSSRFKLFQRSRNLCCVVTFLGGYKFWNIFVHNRWGLSLKFI